MTILLGLTSTKKDRIPAFIEALQKSLVKEIALFPTCLLDAERFALYSELEKIPNLHIPHVHLRTGFTEAEMDYLCSRFGTEVFNIHPALSSTPFTNIPQKYKNIVFVENVAHYPQKSEIVDSGLCLDFSHWETFRLSGNIEYCNYMNNLVKNINIGCCHISAIKEGKKNSWSSQYDYHEYADLSNFDYLKNYKQYFPKKWASLELENSFLEQIKAKAYIEKLLA